MRSWKAVVIVAGVALVTARAQDIPEGGYEVHDSRRPQPEVITPGECSTQEKAGSAPSDAVVLFDGKDLAKWESSKGGEATWKVIDGAMEVVPRSGSIQTKDQFRDAQIHVEWMELAGSDAKAQGRGNSGVLIMGMYELQILDSYENQTYADGMAGSVYGQYPPLVNPMRPPGQWQTYEIIFRAPRYKDGKVDKPATITVLFNGVLVQDHMKLIGPVQHKALTKYPSEHPQKGPIQLQDHGNVLRFRNIWVRELPAQKPKPPTKAAGEHYK